MREWNSLNNIQWIWILRNDCGTLTYCCYCSFSVHSTHYMCVIWTISFTIFHGWIFFFSPDFVVDGMYAYCIVPNTMCSGFRIISYFQKKKKKATRRENERLRASSKSRVCVCSVAIATSYSTHVASLYCTIFNNNVVAYTHLSAQARKKEARAHTRIIENWRAAAKKRV